MSKSLLNHQEKAGTAFSWLNLRLKIESALFSLLILFLPTQLGKHFWPDFAVVSGIRVDYLSPTLYFTDLLVILILMLWLIRNVSKFNLKKISLQKNKLLVFFILFLVLNIWLSGSSLNSFYHLFKLLELCFFGYYTATIIKTSQQIASISLLLSWGVIFESALTIAQAIKQASLGGIFYFFGERLFDGSTPGIANASINGSLMLRPYGTFPHPNVLAGFLLIGLLYIFFTLQEQRQLWTKRIAAIAVLMGSAALVLTLSRVASLLWLSILFSAFFSQLNLFFFKQRKKTLLFFGLSIILIAAVWVSPLGSRLLATGLNDESFVQRKELIVVSTKLFITHPFFGVGLGNFLPLLPSVQKATIATFYLQPVHNIFLLVLAETGFIGLLFFSWFLFKTYRRLLSYLKGSKSSPHRLLVILLTVVLILGSFDHYFLTLQQGQLLFVLVLGLAWSKFKGKFG